MQPGLLSNPSCIAAHRIQNLKHSPWFLISKKTPDLESVYYSLFHSSILKLFFVSSPFWEPPQLVQPSPALWLPQHPLPTTPAAPPALPQHFQSQPKAMFDPKSAKIVQSILHVIVQPPMFQAQAPAHSAPSTHTINPQGVQG